MHEHTPLQIANPMYDAVFKYLMEDPQSAVLLLSTLTDLDISVLEPLPQEMTVSGDGDGQAGGQASTFGLSVYRLDYAARVRNREGQEERVIIMEVQKARSMTEDIRFRKYLGRQYMDSRFYRWIQTERGSNYKSGIPIISIYLLGTGDASLGDVPIVVIKPRLYDQASGETVQARSHFVEALFHEGIIVNVPALRDRRRNEKEQLLSIFDQTYAQPNKKTMLVHESQIPERFRPIVRRLQAALSQQEVGNMMNVEDDFLAEMQAYEEREMMSAYALDMAQRAREEAQRAREEERRAREEERRAREAAEREKEEAMRKQEEEQRAREAAEREKEVAIRLLLQAGISKQLIAQKLGLSTEQIDRIADTQGE